MKKFYLILVVIALILQSCNDDCNQECFTPPQSFSFELVDKTTGENLFTNGTYAAENIEIIDVLNVDEPVTFTFVSEDDINIIDIGSIGWETEIVNLKISVSEIHIFDFKVDAERKDGDCCSFTAYNDIAVTASEFELDSDTGIYKILVE